MNAVAMHHEAAARHPLAWGDRSRSGVMLPSAVFGPFRLDRASELLLRDGRPVRLRPKAFAMLAHLVAASGRLVTKRELIDELWPGVFVDDAALKTCVREVREALGDDAREPRYIETAHRRGYRFIAPVDVVRTPAAAPALRCFTAPRTCYARRGDLNLAYQVIGDGPLDVVFTTGWVSHLEELWAEPSYASFLLQLASSARVILFDTCGTGLSDQLFDLPTAAQRAEEIGAVMDAAGSSRAALFGVGDGGPLCSLFAARCPDRTAALVLYGSYSRRSWSAEYPAGETRQQHDAFIECLRREWGGPVGLEQRAPSRAADVRFRAWWSRYLRLGAGPAAAAALTRMNAELDVREALRHVSAPTLILHRRGDRTVPVDAARYTADRIRSARLVELPGDDHLPFVGDHEAIAEEVERFLAVADANLTERLPLPPASATPLNV